MSSLFDWSGYNNSMSDGISTTNALPTMDGRKIQRPWKQVCRYGGKESNKDYRCPFFEQSKHRDCCMYCHDQIDVKPCDYTDRK